MKKIGDFLMGEDRIDILVTKYPSGQLAVVLQNDKAPYATFSECLIDESQQPGEFFARTRAENEELRVPMLLTGLFTDTGRRVPAGFAKSEVWRLSVKALSAIS